MNSMALIGVPFSDLLSTNHQIFFDKRESQILFGEMVQLTGRVHENFVHVQSMNQPEQLDEMFVGLSGWINRNHLTPFYKTSAIIRQPWAYVRSAPKADADIIYAIPFGSYVAFHSLEENGWQSLTLPNTDGEAAVGWLHERSWLSLGWTLEHEESILRWSLSQTALQFIGAPFSSRGCTLNDKSRSPFLCGIDSAAFVHLVYRLHEKIVPRTLEGLWSVSQEITEPTKIAPGDLLFGFYDNNPVTVFMSVDDGRWVGGSDIFKTLDFVAINHLDIPVDSVLSSKITSFRLASLSLWALEGPI